jgi:hypothetical protein
VQGLKGYACRAIVVEATWHTLTLGDWRSRVTPAAATGTVLGLIETGVPCLLARDHTTTAEVVRRLLTMFARRRWRELRALAKGMEAEQ